MAPSKAFKDMFKNKPSTKGGLATAIPGEIAGYWEAYKIGGKLPWATLFQPAINLCIKGYKVNENHAMWIKNYEDSLKEDPVLRSIFINPKTKKGYKVIKRTFRYNC